MSYQKATIIAINHPASSYVSRHEGKPYLEGSISEEDANGAALEYAFITTYQKVRQLWRDHRTEIEDLLLKASGLNQQKYGLKHIPDWLSVMDSYLTVETPKLELFEKFDHFTTSKLQASVNKGKLAPQHPFFDACETLKTAYETLATYSA